MKKNKIKFHDRYFTSSLMKKIMTRLFSSLMTFVLVITLLSSGGSYAESTPLKLSKEDAKKLVLEYSPVIKNLTESQKDLVKNFTELSNTMEGLRTLYGLLPRYKQLFNQYQLMGAIPGYYTYLDTMAGISASIVAGTMTQDQANAATIAFFDANSGAYPDLQAATQLATNMQVPAYMEYLALKQQFLMLGIVNPNLSSSQEYETFVSPTVIAPMGMQTGVMNLGIAIESTKAALSSGTISLYDSLLMLEGYLELQEKNYEMAVNDAKKAQDKFNAGLTSLTVLAIAQNKETIAQLNRDSMARDVENLMMNFNVMMGLNITTKLELTSSLEKTKALKSLDDYIAKALKERSEIKTLSNNRQNASFEYEKIKEFYSSSNATYKVAEAGIKDKDLEKEQLVQQITLEIHKAYMAVLEKEENMNLKKISMDDAIRQYKELEKNVELGFVTADVLIGLDLMVTQATNDYYMANRNYISAYAALEGASSIGPAYKN